VSLAPTGRNVDNLLDGIDQMFAGRCRRNRPAVGCLPLLTKLKLAVDLKHPVGRFNLSEFMLK